MKPVEHGLFLVDEPIKSTVVLTELNKRESRIVEIPVMTYVAKCLRRLYGNGIIHARHNTLLGKSIVSQFVEIPDELPFPARPVPSDKIKIEINYRLARYYEQWGLHHVAELGIFYEKVVQRMMLQHIVAQIRCEKSIEWSITDFYQLYGIDEDDYARETAKMLYHTHRKKFNL